MYQSPRQFQEGAPLVTDRTLLRLHVEAVWKIALPPIEETLSEMVLQASLPTLPPWSLYLGTFGEEQVTLWNPKLAPNARVQLLQRARQAGVAWDSTLRMRREVAFHAPEVSPEQLAQALQSARVLTSADSALIDAFEPGSAQYFLQPSCAPCIGVVITERLVSIAHTSARTPRACELGINTLEGERRHGYAKAVTTLWTTLVKQQGLVPVYSAFAWNTPSLRLAEAVGYTPAINGVYGPVPSGTGNAESETYSQSGEG
jgi:RimJ/RimL family protein N-acetyltransferase